MNNNPNYIKDSKKGADATKQKWDKIKEEYRINNPSKCIECDTILSYKKRTNKFCSKSCSASYNNKRRKLSKNTRKKIAESLSKTVKEEYYNNPNKCKICDKSLPWNNRKRTTCSDKCFSKSSEISGRKGGLIGGKVSAQVQSEERRSKNEKLFAKKCKEHFNKVLTNEPMFNGWDADVIIEDIKVAVLWNGKWHYEKITEAHSVKQVENRDKIKLKEIKKSGYTPYVIKDMGRFNPDKVQKEFDIFINNLYIQ